MSGRPSPDSAKHRSLARGILTAVLRSLLALVVVLGVLLVSLFSFEQVTLKPLAEFAVERVTGRAFRIEGELEAVAGTVVSVRAGRVSLANAEWGSAGAMLSIGEVEASVDLRDLLAGRYLLENVVVSEARVRVEKNADGLSNWSLGTAGGEPAAAAAEPAPLLLPIRHARLSDIAIAVTDPALAGPLDIRLDRVTQEIESGRALRVNLDARINERPLSLAARVVLTERTAARAAIEFETEAHIEDTRLTADGDLDDLFAPERVNLNLTLASPQIARVAEILGLPAVIAGKTAIEARLAPAGDQHTLRVTGNLGELEIDAFARLRALDSIDGIRLELAAEAPNLAAVIDLPGPRRLPARAFSIDTRLELDGSRLAIEDTRVDLGDIHLSAKGVMSQFPNPEGSNVNLTFEGDDYLELVNLFDYAAPRELKPGPFQLRADLEYGSLDRQTLAVELKLVGLNGRLTGELAGYPSFVGSRVDYRLSGKDAVYLQQWLAYPTPIEGAYSLQGELTRTAAGFDIGATKLTLGENRVDLSGKVGNDPLRRDSELSLRFEGPDLGRIVALSGYDGFFPAGPARIDAAARSEDDGIRVDHLELGFDRSRLRAAGLVTLRPGIAGSRIDLSVSAEDVAEIVPPAFHGYLPAGQPLAATGSFAVAAEHLAIDALQASLGAIKLDASGRLSVKQPLRDASFRVSAAGPDLAAAVPAALIAYPLPAQPFTLDGGIGLDPTGLVLDQARAVIGSEKLQASGRIPLDHPARGLSLDLAASGSDMRILVPAGIDLNGIGAYPYTAAASLGLDNGVLSLKRLKFDSERGGVSGQLSVSIEDPRSFGDFDLAAQGRNLQSLLPKLPHYWPPAEPFELDARGAWSADRVRVERGMLALGGSRIEVSGEAGWRPDQVETGLVLSARGDSLADLGQVEGLTFPDEAFTVDASLESDANRLYIPAVEAKFGDSDLRGRFAYTFGDKPNIEIRLKSQLLDLASILGADEEPAEPGEEAQTADGQSEDAQTKDARTADRQTEDARTKDAQTKSAQTKDARAGEPAEATRPAASAARLIPEVPVPVDQFNRVNLTADIDVAELRFPRRNFHKLEIDASLQDGDLRVSRFRAQAVEGELVARFRATVEGKGIVTSGELEGKDVVLGAGEANEKGVIYPKQNFHLEFDTAGQNSRELAANLNGFGQLTGGQGRMNNSRALDLFGSFFNELLSAVNPFVKREPYTSISCFAAYAEINDGVAKINPGAVMQTDKLDIFARGQVDLRTEQIRLRFDTTPRKGIGISLGDFVNPFVGVGGTMARPRLGLDPGNAMFEGGFAVATGGVSIVITSLYRSWFGSKKPCADFAAKAEKQYAERQKQRHTGTQKNQ